MTEMTGSTRALQCLFGVVCITACIAGCTASSGTPMTAEADPSAGTPDGSDLDPTGNWNLTYQFSAGCGQPATSATALLTVTRGPNGYAVTVSGTAASGSLICAADGCKLSAMFAWSTSGFVFQQSANLALDASDSITGTGTEVVAGGAVSCSVPFQVQGQKD